MTRRLLLAAALLCALPARGASPTLPEAVVSVLTPVDTIPSTAALDRAFAPDAALDRLRDIALDAAHDVGIQLRAIRALPAYCPAAATCGPGTVVHDTLVTLIDRYTPAPGAAQAPVDQLRLIAAVEALGAARSGLQEDVDKLLALLIVPKREPPDGQCPPRRDVRAAAARAVGHLCVRTAMDVLRPYRNDACGQVAFQVGLAVQELEQCFK